MTHRYSLTVLLTLLLVSIPALPAQATFIGDLVYCDVDANGVFDGTDFPLNGVTVRVACIGDDGQLCADFTTVTGTIHPTAQAELGFYSTACGEVTTWNPLLGAADGRYLVEVLNACTNNTTPWACTVEVDPTTLPATCNELVTPIEFDMPADENQDGDFCDPEDGPFPEGQVLGNAPKYGGCEAYPDDAPGSGVYFVTTGFPNRGADECAIYADFGYTPPVARQATTHTPGFWKNHPTSVAEYLPQDFCGTTVTEVCDAVALLSEKGGGQSKFNRHAMAALLSCAAFGCPAEIANLIAAGSDACAAGEPFDWDGAGTTLDEYNNSGVDIEPPPDFVQGAADSKFCK